MMKKNDKDIWLNETMHSLDHINKVQTPDEIFSRIQQRINSGKVLPIKVNAYVSSGKIAIAAVIIGIIFAFNFYSIKKQSFSGTGMEKIAVYYQLPDKDLFYNL
jgi:hypothetical protein